MKQQQIRDVCRFGLGVLVMLMTAAVLIWAMTSAHAQSRSRSFYDGRGSFAGSSITRGNSTSLYDDRGSFIGSAIRHGKETSTYDGRGHYTGSVIDTSPRPR